MDIIIVAVQILHIILQANINSYFHDIHNQSLPKFYEFLRKPFEQKLGTLCESKVSLQPLKVVFPDPSHDGEDCIKLK